MATGPPLNIVCGAREVIFWHKSHISVSSPPAPLHCPTLASESIWLPRLPSDLQLATQAVLQETLLETSVMLWHSHLESNFHTISLKCRCCWVASVVSDSVRPHRRQPTRLPVPGILQARALEWAAVSFSNVWKWKVKVKSLSRVWLLATPWTAAHQAPPSLGFSRQECWSELPLPSPSLKWMRSCSFNKPLIPKHS